MKKIMNNKKITKKIILMNLLFKTVFSIFLICILMKSEVFAKDAVAQFNYIDNNCKDLNTLLIDNKQKQINIKLVDLSGCKIIEMNKFKVYANYISTPKENNNYNQDIEKMLFVSTDSSVDHDVYCNTKMSWPNSVRCYVASKEYCDRVKQFNEVVSKCSAKNLTDLLNVMDEKRSDNEKWYLESKSGFQPNLDLLQSYAPNLSFADPLIGKRKGKSIDYKYMKDDFAVSKSRRILDNADNLKKQFEQDYGIEFELCNKLEQLRPQANGVATGSSGGGAAQSNGTSI